MTKTPHRRFWSETMKLPLAVLLVLSAGLSSGTLQNAQDHSTHHPSAASKKAASPAMDMAKCMKEMQASGERLDRLAAKMDASKGDERVEATSAVVKELVANHKAMVAMCHAMMHSGGMKGMLGMKQPSGPKAGGHQKH